MLSIYNGSLQWVFLYAASGSLNGYDLSVKQFCNIYKESFLESIQSNNLRGNQRYKGA